MGFLIGQVTFCLFCSPFVPQQARKFENQPVLHASDLLAQEQLLFRHIPGMSEEHPLSLCSSGSVCIFHATELKGPTDPEQSRPSGPGCGSCCCPVLLDMTGGSGGLWERRPSAKMGSDRANGLGNYSPLFIRIKFVEGFRQSICISWRKRNWKH